MRLLFGRAAGRYKEAPNASDGTTRAVAKSSRFAKRTQRH
jgi:hypothetical protein